MPSSLVASRSPPERGGVEMVAVCWGLIASIRTDRLLWCPVKIAAHQATNTLGYATDARAQRRGVEHWSATSVTDDVNPCVSAATQQRRDGRVRRRRVGALTRSRPEDGGAQGGARAHPAQEPPGSLSASHEREIVLRTWRWC